MKASISGKRVLLYMCLSFFFVSCTMLGERFFIEPEQEKWIQQNMDQSNFRANHQTGFLKFREGNIEHIHFKDWQNIWNELETLKTGILTHHSILKKNWNQDISALENQKQELLKEDDQSNFKIDDFLDQNTLDFLSKINRK